MRTSSPTNAPAQDGLISDDVDHEPGSSAFPEEVITSIDLNDRGDTIKIIDALWSDHDDHTHLIYVLGIGFLQYNAGAWDEVTDAQVASLISDILDGLKLEALAEVASLRFTLASPTTPKASVAAAKERLEDAESRVRYYGARQRQTIHEVLVRSLKGQRMLQRNVAELDRQHHLLVAANGTVDLRTGEMVENDPIHLVTRRINVSYKPQRDQHDNLVADCPRWDTFLSECHDDADVVAFLQRVTGYSLTGETNEHVFILHAGRGSNGKGTFTNTLTDILEGITTVRSAEMLDPKRGGGQEMAELRGSRLVVVNEGEVGQSISEARLKTLTGGDFITARKLYQPSIQYRPDFTLHFSTNHKPRFRDATDGLWRRLRLVEWKRHFTAEERDNALERKLRQEREGILVWAVLGAVEWYAVGLKAPDSVMAATDEYRDVVDPLSGFLTGEVFTADEAGRVPFKEVHAEYVDWWTEGKAWSPQALRQALEERGARFNRTGGRWMLVGYRKTTPTEAKTGFTVVPMAADGAETLSEVFS